MADPTPAAWRAVGLGVLGGGLAVGFRATRGRGSLGLVALASTLTAGYVVPLMAASRRPPIPSVPWRESRIPAAPGAGSPTFSIVVAARDEAGVLPALVGDVAAQDLRDADGSPRFELIVVDDRSVDGTGAAVRDAAAGAGIGDVVRVIRREGENLADGKGAALTAAPPGVCRGEVVVVLDADARIGPRFLSTLGRYVTAGAGAVTARRRILDAASGTLAGAQADEQTLDGEIQRARWALGGCSEFRGNGIVVRRDLLAAVGGWRAEALTEDIDLSSRLAAAAGVRVAWALDAEVWEEPVRSVGGLWHQRVRWAEGAVRRALEHGPSVLRSPRLSTYARLDFAVYAGQLAIPPAVLGSLAGAVVRRRPGPAIVLVGTYLAAGAALSWDSLRWETDRLGRPLEPAARLGRAVRAGLFNGVWLLAVPRALWLLATRRGAVAYAKMDHLGGGRGEWTR